MPQWVENGDTSSYFNDGGRRLGHVQRQDGMVNGRTRIWAAYINRVWIADYNGFALACKRVEQETTSQAELTS